MNIFVPSLYEVLGVAEDACVIDIKRAYQLLAQECHPDKVSLSGVIPKFSFEQVLMAWHVLGESESRRVYDADQMVHQSKSQRAHYTVKLDECAFNEEEDSFSVSCRCSGKVIVPCSHFELCDHVLVECGVCSLKYNVEM